MKKEFKTGLEKIAYNCRKATFLIEKKQGESLSVREKLELKIHLAGCSICRIYQRQSIMINSLMSELFKETPAEVKLDTNFKATLQQRINDHIVGNN